MAQEKIGDLIRTLEDKYITGETTISKYVSFSQYENLEKIDAYLNSKHISGELDSMERPKPFFNIVTGAVNIWYRATDIDRKDIRIKATKLKDYVGAFLTTVHLQDWMKRNNFGVFLNEWGRSLVRYGSTVIKMVEKQGRLYAEVVAWNRMISDTVDFENNPKIEKLFLTPSQLRKNKNYDQAVVSELIRSLSARETLDGQKKDTLNDYIEIYEVHGELEKSMLTGNDADSEEFIQQIHIVSFVKNDNDEYDDFTLYKGKESQDPYLLTHLIKEDGRSLGIGAVEHLFQAQWMVNHSALAIKNQLDLASKLIFQTSDSTFDGNNVLTNIENGDILIHDENKPLTHLANNSQDITSLQKFSSQWQILAKEITSTPDSISGATMPSGTAYRQVAILNQEAHSLFEIMTENKALAIEEMMRVFIIPHLKKKMNTKEEISATLEDHDITQLDTMFIKNESVRRVNQKVKEKLLSPEPFNYTPDQQKLDIQNESTAIKDDLSELGNQRFIKPSEVSTKTWNDMFKDLEWNVEVEITNESSDKDTVLTTLTTVLQTVATNPMILKDPNMKMLFNKILETTGNVSPIELSVTQPEPIQTPTPQQGQGQSSLVGGDNLKQ